MNRSLLALAAVAAAGVLAVPLLAWQETGAAAGPTAPTIVTLEAKHTGASSLTPQDLRVTVANHPQKVTQVTPVGDTPMQLALLIDDSAGSEFGTEINTIKDWIKGLPPSTQIGIGYMRNGMTAWAHQFTSDHAAAANSVRLTAGPAGADVSPYDSVSDAIKHWPTAPDIQRREVIMISSGMERLGGGMAPENPYVNTAIQNAQKAGVIVYGIYNPSFGHYGHVLWAITYGQNLLSQFTDETGGEAYIATLGAPVDFGPFLRAAIASMQQQYRITLTTHDAKKGLQPLRVRPAEENLQLTSPKAVLVP